MKTLKYIALILLIILVLSIIIFDLGNFAQHDSGAGDIWWSDVESIVEILNNE